MLKEREPQAPTSTTGPPGRPEPVTLDSGGEPLYAMYQASVGEPPCGPRLGVMVLEQLGAHRMNVRLARALVAAGYPVLSVDFRGRGESGGLSDPSGQRHLISDEMVTDLRVAVAELRRRTAVERLVVFGSCQAGHVAARCAATEGIDGLILAGVVNFDEQIGRAHV